MSLRGGRATRALGVLLACLISVVASESDLHAQDVDPNLVIPDSAFAEQPRAPITYYTTYDLNVSRSTWMQNLSYNRSGKRVSFGVDAGMNTLQPVRGLETEGKDGSIAGRLNFRATNQWLWSLDGLFDMSQNEDPRSSTKRRQNKAQLRTQYSTTLFRNLSGTGLAFTELQQEQGLSRKTLLPDTLARDSTYTSGRRDGVSGSLRWTPKPWFEMSGVSAGNWNHLATNTTQRKYVPVVTGGSALVGDSLDSSETPTGDARYETNVIYRGIPKTSVGAYLRAKNGDQTMYAYTRRGLDTLSWNDRSANLRVEHTPLPGGQLVLEGTVGRSFREYQLQRNFNTLAHTYLASANFLLYRPASRVSAGFQVGRVRNDRQVTQNGLVINRAMNAGAARRITERLWLDGQGSLSLYSRRYDDAKADKDDIRGYANAGAAYRVSSRCSTSVHFSVSRGHAVSISSQSSAENNVQTSYQMDALLRLQLSRTFIIQQNYQLNANYFIYDFEIQEERNTLSRVRRVDTVLSDTLFNFALLRFTHNFFAQDFGGYTRVEEDGPRKHVVTQESYVQNVSVTVGIRPTTGILLTATQSLGNQRNYNYAPTTTANRNRWNLNLGAQVDRTLPGELVVQGSIQHIGEYTEADEKLPRREEQDYWLAGATLMKNF